MPHSAGGDPENYMDPPTIQMATLTETLGGGMGGFFANLLDLVGIHRQVAKGPKPGDNAPTPAETQPQSSVPSVLTDVESALIPQETPILPVTDNAPMTTWGQSWIESLKPLTRIDPDLGR